MYDIGKCEICGRDSDQSFGTGGPHLREHICCTKCTEILKTELLALDDNEPPGKAYDRARNRALLKNRIHDLKQKIEELENEKVKK